MDAHMVRNMWLLKLNQVFLHGGLFIIPVIYPYYTGKGLTMAEFMLMEAVFAAVLLVLEVPSGYLSDIWQRKLVLVAGGAFRAAALVMIWLADSFWGLALAQVVWAIGSSLSSGTETALLYDSLLSLKREKEFRRQEGVRHSVGFYAMAVSALLGGVLYSWHPDLPVMAGVALLAWNVFIPLAMVEPPRVKLAHNGNHLKEIRRIAVYATHGHPEIKWILLFSMALFGATLTGFWFQQPYYEALALDYWAFGALLAGIMLASAVVAPWAGAFEDRLGTRRALAMLVACMALGFLGSGAAIGWWGVAAFFLYTPVRGIGQPLIANALNNRISSDIRATVLSVEGVASRSLFILAGPMAGWVMDIHGLQAALLGSGAVFTLMCLWALAMLRRRQVI